jgi:hypothetical protein
MMMPRDFLGILANDPENAADSAAAGMCSRSRIFARARSRDSREAEA